MAVTRINNNQVSDASAGNVYVGINAGTKIQAYSITAGKIANNLTYGSDLTVTGNLTVNGTSTAVNTTVTTIEDPTITLASTQTGTPVSDIGFLGQRGTATNVAWVWKESALEFESVYTSTTGVSNGSPTVTVTGFANIHMGNANIGGNAVHNGTTSFVGNLIGNVNATANIAGGNILTNGLISATGTVTGGNLATGGTSSATGSSTAGSYNTAGTVSATGTITGGNLATGGTASATGNITGGNILTGGIVSAAGGFQGGNLQVGNIIPTANITYTLGNLTNQWKSLYIAGNTIYMGNMQIQQPVGSANTLQITGTDGTTLGSINTGTLSATGTVTGGNLATGGTASATGTITGGNLATGGTASATGNITGGNILTGGLISATGTITSAATITGGNLATGGTISGTGNITGGNVLTGGLVSATANVTGGNITTGGQVSATGNITATANITGGNVLTGGIVSSTGTVTGGNLATGGTSSATGSSTAGSYNTAGTVSATGTITGGNVNTGGNVSATANITGGNVLTGGQVSATGNVTGGNVKTNFIYTITTGDTLTVNAATISLNPTANVGMNSRYINSLADPVQSQDAATKNYVDSVAQGLDPKASVLAATTGTLATASGGTISYSNGTLGVGATLTTTGTFTTIDGVSIASVGARVLVKNETTQAWNGIYTYTSATVLTRSTDMDVWAEVPNAFTFVETGTTNSDTGWVCTANQGGTMGTTAITWTQFSGAGSYTAGNALSLTGTQFNVLWDQTANATIGLNGSNQLYIPAGAVLTTPNIGAATGTSLSVTGTVTAATVNSTTVSASGNVTGGNVLTGGIVSSTGTVTGGNLATGGTSSATGSSTAGSYNTSGTVSAGGNITGANLLTGGLVSATSTITSGATITGGNLATGGTISGTGNVTGGNLLSGGLISTTGNATHGNILTGGLISAAGNITANPSSFFIGNGSQLTGVAASTAGFPISAGTSNIAAATSGNIGITVAGTSNVVTIATSGEYVTGLISANGNIIGGNITTAGLVSATGNVQAGNIRTAGNISATGDILSSANVLVGGYYSAGLGLVSTGNYPNAYSDGIVIDYVTGNGRISVGTADGIQFFNSGVGNITLGRFDPNGNLQVGVSGTGTVTSGNTAVTGTVSATANITGGNLLSGGLISTTGSATHGNIVITGNSINELAAGGTISINSGNANTNFSVSGTAANVFFVNATTNTVSFGSSTQTTNALVAFNATTSILLPVGTTAQRPGTGVPGMQRFNTTTNALEIYNNSAWQSVGATTFTVIADEQFSGTGSQTVYTLGSSQTTSSCIVSINGVVQVPTIAYSVSGTTLTFTEAPAIGDLIDVRELTTTTSVISISNSGGGIVAADATLNQINVTGNLVPTANVTYSLGNATNQWANLYLSGNTIYLGTLQLKASGTTFSVYQSDGSTLANIGASGLSVTSITDGTSAYQFAGVNGNAIITAGGANTLTVTSTGIVTSGTSSVTGTSTAGSYNTAGTVSATGNVTGNYLLGNAYFVTGLSPTQIYSGTSNVTVTGSGANISVGVGGTPNVVVFATTGTYTTGLSSVTGTVTGGNLATGGTISGTGNVTGGNLATGGIVSSTGTVTGGNLATGGTISGTGNVTGGNLATGGNVSGNWMLPTTGVSTGGNILVGGYISVVGNLYVANVVSQGNLVVTDPLVYFQNTSSYPYNYDIGFYSGFTGGTGNTYQHTGVVRDYTDNTWKIASNIPEPSGTSLDFTNAIYDAVKMGNITSTGTVSATGNVTGGNLSVGTGTITGGNIVNSNGNGVGNIGSSSVYFNTVFAKATSAQYADLAEKYTADAEYAPGTVVVFGGTHEVTVNATDADRKVAGVISTNPSYIMNGGLEGANVATVALTGRVPCFVIGPVKKGDMMVSAGLGRARAEADPRVGTVIGKALEDFDGAEGTIEVVVGRF